MKDIPVANVRNFVWLGHTGSGKTSLVDALLFKLGATDRKGSPEQGTSAADWTDEEKNRKITAWAKPFEASYTPAGGAAHRMVMLDTPGYADFIGQVISALSVSDAAVICVDAHSGIQVGTSRVWRQCEKTSHPRAIVITGTDKENVDFDVTVDGLQSAWGKKCKVVTFPSGGKVVDALANGGDGDKDRIEALRQDLMESAAEMEDTLLEEFLNGQPLTDEELLRGLREAVAAGTFVPIFVASGKTDTGLDALLNNIVRLLPSPADRMIKDADGRDIAANASAPFTGFVWRTINDPFVGHLSLVRVWSGTLKGEGEMYNVTRQQKERISGIYCLNGKKQEAVSEAGPGEIVAMPKLKVTALNDTLASPGIEVRFAALQFPNPVMAYAVTPKTQGDEDKLMVGLHKSAEGDPTLRVERNAETHDLIIAGMGDAQINIAVEQLKKNKVEVVLSTPKVAYKETITGRGEGHYKHKKQSGGRGQYGEVYLRVEPKPSEDPDWFVNAVVGGTIPGNFIPAVQKGLVEGMTKGGLAGYPVVNVRATVYDGSYHDVDSSEVAFKIAGARALKDGMLKAKPVLLEPIMKARVAVPETCMGDITGDLNHRRGRILGMDTEDGLQVITAEVPQSEMFQYASQLRSMTGGRGSFDMEFSRMDVVPSNIAQKIIAEAAKHKQEEEE